MDKVAIIGSSGHARVVIDIIREEGKYSIAGLIDSSKTVGQKALGLPVLGRETDLPLLMNKYGFHRVIIAVGDNFVRSEIARRLSLISSELRFISAVHPRAIVSQDVSIGYGSVVMAGSTLSPGSTLGHFCIVNTQASVDHDSILMDYSSLAPGVITGGNCRIGKMSAICIGTVLVHGTHVGEHSVVGAGSLVLASIESFVVAYGRPAKVVRTRLPGEKYL